MGGLQGNLRILLERQIFTPPNLSNTRYYLILEPAKLPSYFTDFLRCPLFFLLSN